jgi:hypothetical protein
MYSIPYQLTLVLQACASRRARPFLRSCTFRDGSAVLYDIVARTSDVMRIALWTHPASAETPRSLSMLVFSRRLHQRWLHAVVVARHLKQRWFGWWCARWYNTNCMQLQFNILLCWNRRCPLFCFVRFCRPCACSVWSLAVGTLLGFDSHWKPLVHTSIADTLMFHSIPHC